MRLSFSLLGHTKTFVRFGIFVFLKKLKIEFFVSSIFKNLFLIKNKEKEKEKMKTKTNLPNAFFKILIKFIK